MYPFLLSSLNPVARKARVPWNLLFSRGQQYRFHMFYRTGRNSLSLSSVRNFDVVIRAGFHAVILPGVCQTINQLRKVS